MTDVTGKVVWGAEYQAFGTAMVDPASTVENNLRFPGQYFDNETGLHYNWHRTYDPVVGRYTQVDPIGFAGGDVNLYRYVGNNSGNWVDPSGLYMMRSTPEAALARAVMSGSLTEAQTIAWAMGITLPPAVIAAVQSDPPKFKDPEDVIKWIEEEREKRNKELEGCNTKTEFPPTYGKKKDHNDPEPPEDPKGRWRWIVVQILRLLFDR